MTICAFTAASAFRRRGTSAVGLHLDLQRLGQLTGAVIGDDGDGDLDDFLRAELFGERGVGGIVDLAAVQRDRFRIAEQRALSFIEQRARPPIRQRGDLRVRYAAGLRQRNVLVEFVFGM